MLFFALSVCHYCGQQSRLHFAVPCDRDAVGTISAMYLPLTLLGEVSAFTLLINLSSMQLRLQTK